MSRETLTANRIRKTFIDFFAEKQHKFIPSSPVVPQDDPTLLFINAGMNQFKSIFLNKARIESPRAVNSQKCIRVSGKHNDLEEVGHDTYHHTFFEMLGNWSFGDYYKKEAIVWAWELLTEVWGLPKDRLWATVYRDDDEAFDLWKSETDIDPKKILRFDEKDNFWEMGETGPCGPCSEIHIDLTKNGCSADMVNAGSPEVIELWNLVFIQYNRLQDGALEDLSAKHVDTGMGFERLVRVLQKEDSNYGIDLFRTVIRGIETITGKSYDDPAFQVPMRVVADHIRMLTFSITDGALPGNTGRGYVLRRILRRAARYGRQLGQKEAFMYRLVDSVVEAMGEAYPEIAKRANHTAHVIHAEEKSFNRTLDNGLNILDDVLLSLEKSKKKTVEGDVVFKLYDTYGFPVDLTRVIARERGFDIDEEAFDKIMGLKKKDDQAATKAKLSGTYTRDAWVDMSHENSPDERSVFLGYESSESRSLIMSYRIHENDGKSVDVILDRTPFYAESGGQVGDTGLIKGEGFALEVLDTQRDGDNIIHLCRDFEDRFDGTEGEVDCFVDTERLARIKPHHSATHLLHAALRSVLGEHVHQQGSLVAPDRLRFDFTHFEKPTEDQLRRIEDMVTDKVRENIPLNHFRNIPIGEAKKMGALAFFGEKYGDRVNVVKFGDFSTEFCGGIHVKSTGEIGPFRIVSESSISAGIRRIEAVTGSAAEGMIEQERATATALRGMLNCRTEEIAETVARLIDGRKALDKEMNDLKLQVSLSGLDELVNKAVPANGFRVLFERIESSDAEEMKLMGDKLRERLGSGVAVLGSVINEKASFVCVVTADLVKQKKLDAGKIVKEIARITQGGGGGKPHLATAGGKDITKIDEALKQAPEIVNRMMAAAK